MALLAAIAVPAFAAPRALPDLAIGDFAIGSAGKAEPMVQPMPFELAGSSFPGSAFYYLAAESEITTPQAILGEGIHSDAESAPLQTAGPFGSSFGGPTARAMRVDNSGVDRSRAEQCLTAAIYYEAASEPDPGQRAVAQVVLNRVAHRSFPNTVCGVVYQGSERSTGCQFSFTCDGSLARVPNRLFWERAANVARTALAGYVFAPVGLSTHYHTFAVHPYWNAKMFNITNIGAHRFFVMPGPAGSPGAFRFAYGGGEPVAAPHPRNAAADKLPDITLDPLALQRAYEAGLKTAQTEASGALPKLGTVGLSPARLAPAPAYTSEQQQRGGEALYRGRNLPEATEILPEFQNSGRWIARPGA